MSIRYLIIDDEHIAHEIVKGYCDLLPHLKLMKHCYTALEALEYLNSNQVDLIFLDLNMPKLKGFEFLKTLSAPPKVIVTTAYSEYALEGYALNVVDYLLKPFSFERFVKAVNKAMLHQAGTPSVLAQTTSPVKPNLFLRSNKTYIQVFLQDILFVEASGNYTKIIRSKKDEIVLREKLSDVLELLPKSDFIQVHKSFAISAAQIERIEGNRIFIQEHIIPIGKLYKMNVQKLLGLK